VASEAGKRVAPEAAGRVETFDVFLSYAGEDRPLAAELAESLRGAGFNVWYDKFELRVGDKLLARINDGLTNSVYGLLLISPAFLGKSWPEYEADVLVRDWIEGRRKLIPIWHQVNEELVREYHPGLAGVVALNTDQGVYKLSVELAKAMVDAARTVAFIPGYMEPVFRFLRGTGELTLEPGHGRAFTLWEALVHFDDDDYPLWVGGRTFTRTDLLEQASHALAGGFERPIGQVGEEGLRKIREMLVEHGLEADVP
jgi:hypothetical protein